MRLSGVNRGQWIHSRAGSGPLKVGAAPVFL
jgi:hypothetical protein